MDFVTITDHDTIDGCLELVDRPDCFVSEELTARFAGEPQAVHVLCYGITPGGHEWLQAPSGDVEACAAYLAANEIASALAHPFYNVDAPLSPRHRRRLAELFPIWEVRNSSRAAELNMPASTRPSSAGSRAGIWPAPTPAPTSSSSARPPTPTDRSCSRPAPAACPGRGRRRRPRLAGREPPHTGMFCQADADHIAGTVLQLAASPLLRRHLGACAVRAAGARSWEQALEQLTAGYRRALGIDSRFRLSPTSGLVKVGSAGASVQAG